MVCELGSGGESSRSNGSKERNAIGTWYMLLLGGDMESKTNFRELAMTILSNKENRSYFGQVTYECRLH